MPHWYEKNIEASFAYWLKLLIFNPHCCETCTLDWLWQSYHLLMENCRVSSLGKSFHIGIISQLFVHEMFLKEPKRKQNLFWNVQATIRPKFKLCFYFSFLSNINSKGFPPPACFSFVSVYRMGILDQFPLEAAYQAHQQQFRQTPNEPHCSSRGRLENPWAHGDG